MLTAFRSTVYRLYIGMILGLVTAAAVWSEEMKVSDRWQIETKGAPWVARVEPRPAHTEGRLKESIAVAFPGVTEAQPGSYAGLARKVALQIGRAATLSFHVRDNFTGPTAGYIFAESRVNGQTVWSSDVAGGQRSAAEVKIKVPAALNTKGEVKIELGVWLKRRVTNFPVEVVWSDVVLAAEGAQPIELTGSAAAPPIEPLPPDLPLAAAPAMLDWTPTARILQPWGRTEWLALAEHKSWAKRLSEELGFNAIIILPPGAHNATAAVFYDKTGKLKLSDEQFEAALASYRAAGFKIILYSSIMHCGHAPAWQLGALAKEHPNWLQRDADGGTISQYRAEWLCPSTPALDYTLRYTQDIVQRWKADAVMLDNNEFLKTAAGKPTCYCEYCQHGFRRYIRERFGSEQARRVFGIKDIEKLRIPTERGDLFNMWIHWRNRVWAEATKTFRAKLREIRPEIVLLSNTQYLYSTWLLATDLQYPHEDAVLAESRGLTPARMSDKMLLGLALARGRPLWNYIGTFEERDVTRLRPAEVIAGCCAASQAQGAQPWIVFYGFEKPSPSLDCLRGYIRLAERYAADWAKAKRMAHVVSLFSLRSRNYRNGSLIPSHLNELRRAQIPVEPLLARDLPSFHFTHYDTLIAEGVGCLTEEEAKVLASWVKGGGRLIATPDVGWYDEIGRLRSTSMLFEHLGATPPGADMVGKGSVVWVDDAKDTAAALKKWAKPMIVLDPPTAEWELVPYRQTEPQQIWIHAVWHGAPDAAAPVEMTFQLPDGFTSTAVMWVTPGGEQQLDFALNGNLIHIPLPDRPSSGVIRIIGARTL